MTQYPSEASGAPRLSRAVITKIPLAYFVTFRCYGTWLHGQAVAAGMALAARFSARLGRLPAGEAERLFKEMKRREF